MYRWVLLAAAANALAADAPFTLDQVMAKPFASELTGGPGSRLAWTVNVEGVRNVWVAEPPGYRGRAVTRYTEDDGEDIGGLCWLKDGKGILFVRGGDLEHPHAEVPNPLHHPSGAAQGVWLVTLDGKARKLADGNSVAAVAGADFVVFTKGGGLFSVGLAEGAKPAELAKPRGGADELAAAPDGGAVAFLSQRQDHGFVGVYRFADKSLRYLDPSVDTDIEPVWSPDSKSVAFIRIATRTGLRVGPVRAVPDPWSIRVADAATGHGREVWRAAAGPGSAFRELATSNLLWSQSGRLIFPWERDGWLHLYSVPATGGTPALLTPGEFEVEHTSLAPDGRTVVYSSNQADIDRRHIWSVPADGSARPEAVTTGRGIEWKPVALEGGGVGFLRADAQLPSRAAVRVASEQHDMTAGPAGFPATALVEPQPVVFPAADGMSIHGQLFVPKGATGPRPAVIFFHGGSRRQMLVGWHYGYYYNNAYALNQYLAALGYVVLSVNYRSGIGYGLEFREAIGYGMAGASEYNDVIGAGLYLRNRADVDPKRIGLWGGSYGGYLVALGLARGSELFAAGVDFHGVHDWSKLRGFEEGSPAMRTAFESSPMASVKTWRSPVLLIHGDDDRNVPFSQTVRLVEALRAQKVDFEESIVPDEIHDFLVHRHWVDAYRATADFLERKLR
jgi:dipeptidyl aminopeptidase/acylaminoacyl peptidase